ncbi:MAG: hypothetical protein JW839_14660 [Candidatus Lokiarchaeota archaeon]|nr:hypothetical protein [Candidatus Lokiarchaeota archaeon]
MIEMHLPALPIIPRASLQDMNDASVKRVIPYLSARICPLCQGSLKIDQQPESTFAFCDNCHDFDVSVHMDMETKAVVLGYSSLSGPEGFVDPDVLASLNAALLRREYAGLR